MQKFKTFFKRDRFATTNGIELIECKPGYAVATVTLADRHLNGANVVHGGLLFTLADFAFATALNSYGNITLSINASMTYFTGCSKGTIKAVATEIARSNRLAHCDINVFDDTETLLANFKGTAYITKGIIEF